MRVWRLVKTRYAATAFDGEGPRLYGGRWNSVGVRVAYGSSNSALAVLEVLVHLENTAPLPSYSMVAARLPDELIEDYDTSVLPANWSASPIPPEAQAIGDEWVRSGRSLALRVPSAVVTEATNLLINPKHADFKQFTIETIDPYSFDPRLVQPLR
jgi:RES domain-containing protein